MPRDVAYARLQRIRLGVGRTWWRDVLMVAVSREHWIHAQIHE